MLLCALKCIVQKERKQASHITIAFVPSLHFGKRSVCMRVPLLHLKESSLVEVYNIIDQPLHEHEQCLGPA